MAKTHSLQERSTTAPPPLHAEYNSRQTALNITAYYLDRIHVLNIFS